jgi:hydrogenase maturation protease
MVAANMYHAKLDTRILPSLSQQRVALVGIGNQLRGDDGAGPEVLNELMRLAGERVTFKQVQQLDIGLAEWLGNFDIVLFIDASLRISGIEITELTDRFPHAKQLPSHELDPGLLAQLCQTLFNDNTRFFLIEIGAQQFDINQSLSQAVQQKVHYVSNTLLHWLQHPIAS